MNSLVPFYVRLETFVRERAEKARGNAADKDRGVTIIEYAALLVLVAALVAALYAAGLITKFTSAVSSAIGTIFTPSSGGGGSGS
jgi:Flp pilus assembly pilin Flp